MIFSESGLKLIPALQVALKQGLQGRVPQQPLNEPDHDEIRNVTLTLGKALVQYSEKLGHIRFSRHRILLSPLGSIAQENVGQQLILIFQVPLKNRGKRGNPPRQLPTEHGGVISS